MAMRRLRRALAAAALAMTFAAPAGAQDGAAETAAEAGAETGAQAFKRRDFATAAALWRRDAAAGSANAKLGLGLLADLGLGTPRDPARALRLYLEAAEEGLPAAQFNVGVMLDAGTGSGREPAAAAGWYGRAAAGGHRRAQYNLGLLYEAGEGVERNPDLARHWLDRAAEELAAARELLSVLGPPAPGDRSMAAPRPIAGALVRDADGPRAELVWTAPPGPEGAGFLVEVLRLPSEEAEGRILASLTTDASALRVDLPAGDGAHAWRVSRVEARPAAGAAPRRYAASPWRPLGDGDDVASAPRGRVVIRLGRADAPAGELAREIVDGLKGGGLWTEIERVDDAPAESAVSYAYAEDRDLAEGVADFLPVLRREDAVPDDAEVLAPGEIVVHLAGGPSGDAPQRAEASQASIVPAAGAGR